MDSWEGILDIRNCWWNDDKKLRISLRRHSSNDKLKIRWIDTFKTINWKIKRNIWVKLKSLGRTKNKIMSISFKKIKKDRNNETCWFYMIVLININSLIPSLFSIILETLENDWTRIKIKLSGNNIRLTKRSV